MPTRVGQTGYRRFGSSLYTRQIGAELTGQTVWLRGPWAGFEPDLDPAQATPGACRATTNLLDREGLLTFQNGFDRIDPAHLPLGTTALPAGASAEPVVGIFEGRTNATQVIRKYALTADTGADGGGFFGHFYELVAGAWTHRAAHTPANGYKGDQSTLADWAHFATGDFSVFVGGPGQSFVWRFPGIASATDYEEFSGASLGAVSSLGARSVCVNEERIMVLNTIEGGTVFPGRLRWTNKGAAAKFDPTATGAGFADFNDFGSEGLAVRTIGPKIACYFVNGGQFITRTGNVVDPFKKDYGWFGRGLLSTHSIVDLGQGVHFGIFTDGWFFLDYTGAWREVGVKNTGYYKWKNTFYNQLSWANRQRVTLDWSPSENLIYIAWPNADTTSTSGEPTDVWIYDIKTDSLWNSPDYPPQQPNLISSLTEDAQSGITWNAETGTWDTHGETWDSLGPRVGLKRITHGTRNGLVFSHTPNLISRDGSLPSYSYQGHFFSVNGQTQSMNRVNRVPVSYTRVGAPTPITVIVEGNNGKQATGVIKHTKGTVGEKQVDFMSGTVSDFQHSISLSGTHPVEIDGIGVTAFQEDIHVRRET